MRDMSVSEWGILAAGKCDDNSRKLKTHSQFLQKNAARWSASVRDSCIKFNQ